MGLIYGFDPALWNVIGSIQTDPLYPADTWSDPTNTTSYALYKSRVGRGSWSDAWGFNSAYYSGLAFGAVFSTSLDSVANAYILRCQVDSPGGPGHQAICTTRLLKRVDDAETELWRSADFAFPQLPGQFTLFLGASATVRLQVSGGNLTFTASYVLPTVHEYGTYEDITPLAVKYMGFFSTRKQGSPTYPGPSYWGFLGGSVDVGGWVHSWIGNAIKKRRHPVWGTVDTDTGAIIPTIEYQFGDGVPMVEGDEGQFKLDPAAAYSNKGDKVLFLGGDGR